MNLSNTAPAFAGSRSPEEVSAAATLIENIRKELGPILEDAPGWGAWTGTAAHHPLDPEAARGLPAAEIAPYVDHTLLKPEATRSRIERLCEETLRFRFAAVCVNPDHVEHCARRLDGSGVAVATVVGFPLGASMTSIKAEEARAAIETGADELDMVINLGRLKDRDWVGVLADVRAVVEAGQGRPVKVILESGGLEDGELVAASLLSRAAGAAYVKTSTGFLFGGATERAVWLMRLVAGVDMGVKASGGIRDARAARAMLAAGATRIGASASLAIISAASSK